MEGGADRDIGCKGATYARVILRPVPMWGLANAEIKARGFSAKEHFARLFVVQVVLGDVVLLC